MLDTLQQLGSDYPYFFIPLMLLLAYLLYRLTRYVLARSAYFIALRTSTIYDDLFVDRLQPFRVAWLLPIFLLFKFSVAVFPQYPFVEITALLLIIWLVADFINAILSGINDVYKHHPRYSGVSVAGYIGILKVFVVVAATVLTLSLSFDIAPIELLSGVGTWLAVLLLIFRDTIESFLASVQISTQKLIKEGDAVDIPAFGASGIITNIDLQTVTIQNYDNTVTAIPTNKMVEVGFKNYRIMIEGGARRLKRSLLLDAKTIKFADAALLKRLKKVDFINQHLQELTKTELTQITNLQLFMHYAEGYLRSQKPVRQKRYPFVIHALEPTSKGLPLEVYVFIKAASWDKSQVIQSEIMIHLIAVLTYFELAVYQDD